MSMWIPTVDGAVNAAYVVRVARDGDGTVLHLTTGDTVRSSKLFEVVDSDLVVIEHIDFEDDDPVPFDFPHQGRCTWD